MLIKNSIITPHTTKQQILRTLENSIPGSADPVELVPADYFTSLTDGNPTNWINPPAGASLLSDGIDITSSFPNFSTVQIRNNVPLLAKGSTYYEISFLASRVANGARMRVYITQQSVLGTNGLSEILMDTNSAEFGTLVQGRSYTIPVTTQPDTLALRVSFNKVSNLDVSLTQFSVKEFP